MNTSIGKLLFFAPDQNWQAYLPYLAILAVLVIATVVMATFFVMIRQHERWVKEKHTFYSLAEKFKLSRRESTFMRRIAKVSGVRPIHRVFNEQDRFERTVKRLRGWHRRDRQQFLESIRQKVYGHTFRDLAHVRNTYDLIPGARLLLQETGKPGALAWAHLIDVDDSGLIVVIARNEPCTLALRPETRIEASVYLPNRDPIRFRSQVDKIVPGPSRMAILKHAGYVFKEAA